MRSTFKILIVEDELMIAEMTKEMLLDLKYSIVGIAKNYNQAQAFLAGDKKIDLAILDINLSEKKSGIDVGKEINEKYKLPFIYLTSYSDPQTIRNASMTTPDTYLLKPFTKGDLHTTIEMIRARQYQSSRTIIVKEGDLQVKIESKDIYYIRSDNNYIEVVMREKKYVLRKSLDSFFVELEDPNFIRIHRSYVANILKITAINGQYVLIGSEKCPLSRSYKEDVTAHFLRR